MSKWILTELNESALNDIGDICKPCISWIPLNALLKCKRFNGEEMSNAMERKIMRWTHLILSIPIIGYIYGPVAERPEAVFVTRVFFVPIVILSGLWMWKGHLVKKLFKKRRAAQSLG